MTLAATTYSANRGYAWSSVPEGLSSAALDGFSRAIAESRGDFGDALAVDVGLVSDGRLAAVYTRQNVANWDCAGRASDYIALALFPVPLGRLFDFVDLVNNGFFWTPSRTPPRSIEYVGGVSAPYPADLAETLGRSGRGVLANPRAMGSLLAAFGSRGGAWSCRLNEEGNALDITCAPWI